MESIAGSIVAGMIAALAATTIMGVAKYVRDSLARRQDVKYIRALLIEGRGRVKGARNTLNKLECVHGRMKVSTVVWGEIG